MALRNFGKLDNASYFQANLGADPIIKDLVLENVNTWPCIGNEWSFPAIPSMAYALTVGRSILLYGPDNYKIRRPLVGAVAHAEILAPMLAESLLLPQAEARKSLVSSVKELMKWDGLDGYTSNTRTEYLLFTVDGDDVYSADSIFGDANSGANNSAKFPLMRERDWPATAADIDSYNMSPGTAMGILYSISQGANKANIMYGVDCITNTIVSVIKRGNATQQFLDKVTNDLTRDLGKNVNVDYEVVRSLYQYYGSNINSVNIKDVVNRWESQIPKGALRLMLTVQQAAGGGMTSYFTIREAIKIFPAFDWARISLLLPTDWANFSAALNLVGNNMYYGFNTKLGEAASTKYKNLAWVAKELLIRGDGRSSLSRYGGWTSKIPHQDTITKLIDDAVAARSAAIQPADVQAVENSAAFKAIIQQAAAAYQP